MRKAIGICALFLLGGCATTMHGTVVDTASPSVAEVQTRSGEVAMNDTVKIVHRTCGTGHASNAARRHCEMTYAGTATVVNVRDAQHVLVRARAGATLHDGDIIVALDH